MTLSTSANEVKKLIDNLKRNVNGTNSYTIASETCIGEFDEHFKCLICFNVVLEP